MDDKYREKLYHAAKELSKELGLPPGLARACSVGLSNALLNSHRAKDKDPNRVQYIDNACEMIGHILEVDLHKSHDEVVETVNRIMKRMVQVVYDQTGISFRLVASGSHEVIQPVENNDLPPVIQEVLNKLGLSGKVIRAEVEVLGDDGDKPQVVN